MTAIDRIISDLIASPTDLTRESLQEAGEAMLSETAPLETVDTVRAAVDSIVGFGVLEPLLEDPDVSDVLVNGPNEVWIERNGELHRTSIEFRSADDIVAMVRRSLAPLGLRIDHAEPAVDARLPDGSRLHAVIPPAAVDSPIVAIRRFHHAFATLDDLRDIGGLEEEQVDRLRAIVRERQNIVVAGPTGAGKTTLLNTLCAEIEPSERVVTIEDAAELRLGGHVVRLESRRANVEGVGDITIRQLVRHALRLRPDRIIVGEVRGAEALDMVQALSTGHRGSMSTIHANGPVDALARLETLAAMAAEDVPHAALASLVRGAIDVVVFIDRFGGRRVVSDIVSADSLRGDA